MNFLNKKYDSIKKLRHEIERYLGHDFPLTAAECSGKLNVDPLCDTSCSSCEYFSSCVERGIPFMENGCDHFVHAEFDELRMASFNGIHLNLYGGDDIGYS